MSGRDKDFPLFDLPIAMINGIRGQIPHNSALPSYEVFKLAFPDDELNNKHHFAL